MPLTSDDRIDLVLDDLYAGREPRLRLTKAEGQALIGDFYLTSGGGEIKSLGSRKQRICVMQTANVLWSVTHQQLPTGLSDSNFENTPEYTGIDEIDPLLEQLFIHLNDSLGDDKRQDLMRYIPRLFNTKVDEKTERRSEIMRDMFAQWTWAAWKKDASDNFDIRSDLPEKYWDHDAQDWKRDPTKKDWLVAARNAFDPMEPESLMDALIVSDPDLLHRFIERMLRAR